MNPSPTPQSSPTREQNSQPEFNKGGNTKADAEKKAKADKPQAQNNNPSTKS